MNTPVSLEIERLLIEKDIDMPVSPTIAEVVMWLYNTHRIWIDANFLPNVDKFSFIAKPIDFKKPKEFSSYKEYYNATSKFISKEKFESPTEAYSQAIIYTLKNLI